MNDVDNIRIIGIQIKNNGQKIENTASNFKKEFGRSDKPNRGDFINKIKNIVSDLTSDINTLNAYLESV